MIGTTVAIVIYLLASLYSAVVWRVTDDGWNYAWWECTWKGLLWPITLTLSVHGLFMTR